MKEIKNVLICGAGLMGNMMAYTMALDPEHSVTVYNHRDKEIEPIIRSSTKELIEHGIVTQETVNNAISRITFTTDLDSDSDGDKRISLKGGVLDVNVDTRYFYYDDDSASDALTFNVTAGAAALDPVYADALEGTVYRNASVADNRQSFFYTVPDVTFPPGYNMQNGHCPICDEELTATKVKVG